MSDLGKNLLWVLAAAQISCSSVQETLESAQRIDSDMTYASRVSYRGPDPSDIVGGQEVSRTDPTAKLAVLLLISRNSRLSTCTGVLIAKRVVLTAAHCVTNVEAQDVRILFRTRINEVPAGLETFAEKIRIHEKFDGKANSFSDLALLRLKSEAPPQYAPVPLFENGEKMIGDFVLLVGYGITDEKQKDSLTLRKTIKSLKNDIHIKHTFLGIEQKTNTGGFWNNARRI